jgi:hypothetical protein
MSSKEYLKHFREGDSEDEATFFSDCKSRKYPIGSEI